MFYGFKSPAGGFGVGLSRNNRFYVRGIVEIGGEYMMMVIQLCAGNTTMEKKQC